VATRPLRWSQRLAAWPPRASTTRGTAPVRATVLRGNRTAGTTGGDKTAKGKHGWSDTVSTTSGK
jgi:hypothetical protein